MRTLHVGLAFMLAAMLGCDETGSGGNAGAGAGAAGAAGAGGTIDLPDPLAPLPPAAPAESELFTTSGACAQCHLAAEDGPLHDDAGLDVSPVKLWRSSMMALAARDPFYLAVFSHELEELNGASLVETACSRCHAPAAAVEHGADGSSFAELTTSTSALGHLGREGVTCSLCHQLTESAAGSPAEMSGVFEVGTTRAIFGPHQNPDPEPMQFFVDFTPTYSEHFAKSEVCAGCHTGGAAVPRVEVELLYQTISPEELDHLARVATPAAVRFSNMAAERAPLPTVLATASREL